MHPCRPAARRARGVPVILRIPPPAVSLHLLYPSTCCCGSCSPRRRPLVLLPTTRLSFPPWQVNPKREKKTLVVGRRFQAGSGGKKSHNVKYVDSRTRTDTRGEKRAESKKKKGKGGASPGQEQRKGRHQHKKGHYKRK